MTHWILRILSRAGVDVTIVRDAAPPSSDSSNMDLGRSAVPPAQFPPHPSLDEVRRAVPAEWRDWRTGNTVLGLYEVKATIPGGMGVIHRVRHLGWGMDRVLSVRLRDLS